MKKHETRKHALLSASGASKWMNCTPSARMEEKYEQSTSSFAQEGTLAHEFADISLQFEEGLIDTKQYDKQLKKLRSDALYTDEMEEHVQKYIDYVYEQKSDYPFTELFIEDKIDLTAFIEEGFGTSDATILNGPILDVIDLKYGKGIKVDADNNAQLMLYGLGAFYKHELTFDIKTVRLSIVQPRLDHISTWEISAAELMLWGEAEVRKQAEAAYAGEGEPNPGSHCKWCRAKPRCKALADFTTEMAKLDFQEPKELTDKQLLEVFSKQPLLIEWSKAVAEYLLKEALGGKSWEGYKVVEGRSNRKWGDIDAVLKALSIEGFSEDQIFNSRLKGIGDIEKLVGKAEFPKLLGKCIIKPQGAPALVVESDKRPAIGIEQAKKDFE